jgi:hypothetical protein
MSVLLTAPIVDWAGFGSQLTTGFAEVLTGIGGPLVGIAVALGGIGLVIGLVRTLTGWKG